MQHTLENFPVVFDGYRGIVEKIKVCDSLPIVEDTAKGWKGGRVGVIGIEMLALLGHDGNEYAVQRKKKLERLKLFKFICCSKVPEVSRRHEN